MNKRPSALLMRNRQLEEINKELVKVAKEFVEGSRISSDSKSLELANNLRAVIKKAEGK